MIFGAFDTETINRPLHGEACLLIKKVSGTAAEFLEFPKTFDQIFAFLKGRVWVCWNMDFDARAIIHPFFTDWKYLVVLGEREKVEWGGYRLEYIPSKKLIISDGKSSFTLYDLRQFFGMSLESASKKFLSASEVKKAIPKSWYSEMDKCLRDSRRARVLDYAGQDVIALEGLLKLTLTSYAGAGLEVKKLTSPAAMSAQFYSPKWPYLGRVPDGINRVFQAGFYGGRIECFELGRIRGPLWNYDIHSAYPAVIADLRPFEFRLFTNKPEGESYSVHHIRLKIPASWKIGPIAVRQGSSVIYPVGEFKTWCGGDMLDYLAELGIKPELLHSWYLPITGGSVWPQTRDLFLKRKDPVSGLALKLVMNSWYGKLCEQDGRSGKDYQPYGRYCAFPWAMVITERTRIKLARLLYKLSDGVIFAATDGVLSRQKLDDSYLGPGLGEWGLDCAPHEAVVIGCGRYFLYDVKGEIIKQHLRGFPANYSEKKLKSCRQVFKRIPLLDTLSLKEWTRAYAMPDFNVLADMKRELRISDDKRQWDRMFARICDAWTRNFSSQSLILGLTS